MSGPIFCTSCAQTVSHYWYSWLNSFTFSHSRRRTMKVNGSFSLAGSLLLLSLENGLAFTSHVIRHSQLTSIGAKHSISQTRLSMGLLDNIVNPGAGDAQKRIEANNKYLDGLQKRVDRINALESSVEDLGDEELQAKTIEFRHRLAKGEDINGPLLEEAFAVVREAAWCVQIDCVQ